MGEEATEPVGDLKWEVDTLRLTALLPSSDLGLASDHWKRVVGDDPEVSSTHKGGERKAEGPFRDGKLSLVIKPERVDWLYSAIPVDASQLTIATAGRFTDAVDVIKQVASAWTGSEHCPSFQRLALGAVLLSLTKSRESGYRELAQYLPAVTVEPLTSQDLVYQINRPRACNCLEFDLVINRLSKWAVGVIQTTGIVVTGGARTRALTADPMYACRLELDVNTDAEFDGVLDPSQVEQVFGQLCQLGVEIAQNGDQP